MRRCVFYFLFLFFSFRLACQDPIPPIGFWREHLPYKGAIDVAAANEKIFCATPYSLFAVSTGTNEINRYSRVTGLSETGISAIRFDEAGKKLLIAYTNSNIDLLTQTGIKNIPDIKRDNIIGDKSIYAIYPLGSNFYLSTGLGVVVIDAVKNEVKDTWLLGSGGNPVKVNGFASDNSFFYAATEEGLKKIAFNASNPADVSNWQLVSGTANLSSGACQNVFASQSGIYVEKNDSLFIQNNNNWFFVYTDGWPIISSQLSENKILLCERQSNGSSRLVILNTDGTVARIIDQVAAISFPQKAILVNNDPWVADLYACLSHFGPASTYDSYILNSPQAIAGGEMVVYNSVFYAAAGAVNDAWNYLYNGDGIYQFKEGQWINTNRYIYSAIDSLLDYITIAIDKRDESIWAGSYGGGLLHVKNGPSFEIFKQGYIGPTVGDPTSYRVSGLAFDTENNLWISNFGATEPLKVKMNDGVWVNFSIPFLLFGNALSQIIIDDNNYKWIVAPSGNGLVCFDHGNSIENTGDDRWKRFTVGVGNGNLPTNEVVCLAKDKTGFIWVGTTDGIAVIQCPDRAFDSDVCDAILPIVPNGNFAGYLFKGQEIRAIAVDGANRKWVATKNGVFLISANGEKVVFQFTESNSPLLSNDVKKITIDGHSGEVYFATAKGICSFRSTATEGEERNQNVLVFPNPVLPGYTGTIAIRGLVNNAIVKITELDGRLVFQTRALGGQAIWNGRNYKGQPVVSGAYLVVVIDEGGNEKTANKIFFIQK